MTDAVDSFCPHCGTEHQPEDSFCRGCGAKLEPTTATAAARSSTGTPSAARESSAAGADALEATREAVDRKRWVLPAAIFGLMLVGVLAVLAIGGVFSGPDDSEGQLSSERKEVRPALVAFMTRRDELFKLQRRYIRVMSDANEKLDDYKREDRTYKAENKRIEEEFADEFDQCAKIADLPCPTPDYPDPPKVPSVAKQARALRSVSDDLGALTAQVQSQTPSKELQVAETQLLSATEKLSDEASHNADVLDEAVTAAQGNDVGAVNRGKLRTIRALTALPAIKQMNRALIILIDRLRLPRTQYDVPGGRDLDDTDSSTAT